MNASLAVAGTATPTAGLSANDDAVKDEARPSTCAQVEQARRKRIRLGRRAICLPDG